ncbi:MAG TPA: maleylacetoacetate isomerase [Gammaproteobacteria bacterium]|nr:maleylacetoacetate isomerase [Gammaproteobacteria bacterium]
MEVYTYFRSSAAYRARIVLNLKGLKADYRYVHLLKDGGEQHKPEFKAVNPQCFIPALVDRGHTLTQSLAIAEYVDEIHPEPRLLPRDPLGRARVRALALIVACDIHPLNNQRVMQYLAKEFGADADVKKRWMQRWMADGFAALEKLTAGNKDTGKFCHGDTPTIADAFLVPQMFNARRFELDLAPYPTLRRIDEHCLTLKAFSDAAPNNQPDFEA